MTQALAAALSAVRAPVGRASRPRVARNRSALFRRPSSAPGTR